MNVASLEPCKELFKLSGWEDTDEYHYIDDTTLPDGRFVDTIPAYDLGYLLRKLIDQRPSLTFDGFQWVVMTVKFQIYADTPEDAAAELCIKLFKEGILPKTEVEPK